MQNDKNTLCTTPMLETVVSLAYIDRISIWRHSCLYDQWRHMRILPISAKETTFSVHGSASSVYNLGRRYLKPLLNNILEGIISVCLFDCLFVRSKLRNSGTDLPQSLNGELGRGMFLAWFWGSKLSGSTSNGKYI